MVVEAFTDAYSCVVQRLLRRPQRIPSRINSLREPVMRMFVDRRLTSEGDGGS